MDMNLGGHKFLWYDGYGRLTLGFGQALRRNGHTVYPFEVGTLDEKPAWYLDAQGLSFDRITVQMVPPSQLRALSGRSVCYSMHESTALPSGWGKLVNDRAEVLIVPSPWLIPVFRNGGVTLPIEVVPGGIDPEETPILRQRRDRPYRFMALGDRATRKGWDKAKHAFYKAFDVNNKNVQFIVKARPGSFKGKDNSHGRDDRVRTWVADVQAIADVYSQCDAFLFPSRCEGYGMPPREAAACGIPTVVLRYSGTADDCDQWAIPLEHYTLIESGMKECGGAWAEPSLDELIWRMRDMVEHQDEYKARALKSAQWLRDNHTYTHAADKLVNTINRYIGTPEPSPVIVNDFSDLPLMLHSTNGHNVSA